MCGIAGIVSLDGVSSSDLHKMSVILRHRGPDDEGFSIINRSGQTKLFRGEDTISEFSGLKHIGEVADQREDVLGLIHRRLSILDLSSAGHQPMSYAAGRYQIIFNGEVYNFKELRTELISAGYQFVSDSDTEVVMASYDKWGKDCVQKFVGMWAFVLYDTSKKQLFLSRDRFGIKPLYYSTQSGKFVFASEIKALLALDFVKPEANMPAVYEFICFSSMSNHDVNLFRQVTILPPAHNLFLNLSDLNYTIEKYYDLEKNVSALQLPSESEIENEFKNLLSNSIDLHLRSDVPVGSALSGGLDSSTVVAMAALKMKGDPFKTFTAAYLEKDIDESGFAKKVISRYKNIDGHFIYPDAEGYWEDLDKLTWHQDLPINSTSMFAQWEVMKLAKQNNIKVLLDGQGADEILGGYYNFAGIFLLQLLKEGKLAEFLREKNALKQNFSPNIKNTIAKALYYFLPQFVQRGVRSKYRLGMNFISSDHQNEIRKIQVPLRGGKTYKQHSILSTQFGLQDLLRHEDRNSMAFSIESRVPFLDHRVVEFSIALDNGWKIKNGWTKYILRKTAASLVDEEVAWRKFKMGFLTPQKIWKVQSKSKLDAFVNETTLPSFLDKNYLLKLNSADINDSSHLSEFWKMISFLKWAEVFKVNF